MTTAGSLAFTGGTVITLNPDFPAANTLILKGERIWQVGLAVDLAEELKSAWEVVDLQGKAVLPGFIDTHAHLIATGLAHFMVDLTGVRSLDEGLAELKSAAEDRAPGEWIVSYGLTAGLLRDASRLPSRRELDTISDRSPIFVGERTGHACALNSAGLARLDLPPETDGFLQDRAGEPLGCWSLLPTPSLLRRPTCSLPNTSATAEW